MDGNINISLEIDSGCESPQVIIRTADKTELVEKVIRAIERCVDSETSMISVTDKDRVILLKQEEIYRIYTQNRRLVVCTADAEYESRLTLREFEEILDSSYFVRISRFEIANLNKIFSFDLSIAGTIRVIFEGGSETWVSRRYVKIIQDKLHNLNRGGGSNE